jgi:hypothetical protein
MKFNAGFLPTAEWTLAMCFTADAAWHGSPWDAPSRNAARHAPSAGDAAPRHATTTQTTPVGSLTMAVVRDCLDSSHDRSKLLAPVISGEVLVPGRSR